MNTSLVPVGLARGTLLHFAHEGSAKTLCGRSHGRNPRYITNSRAERDYGRDLHDDVDCRKCLTIAAEETR